MEAAAKAQLKDAAKIAIWDEQGTVFFSNFQTTPAELKQLTSVFGDRDEAIRQGLVAGGVRYEVHRHHPPAVYGRTMGGHAENSEGAAIYKVPAGPSGQPSYAFITYQMPNVSARMVSILQSFCDTHLAAH